MYVSFDDVRNYTLVGDEDLGVVSDIYLDERDWTTSYFVVDTGTWFSSNKVLVAASRITNADPENRRLQTNLSKTEIEAAPSAQTEKTVGDVKRAEWATVDASQSIYFAGMHNLALPASIYLLPKKRSTQAGQANENPEVSTHLRSSSEILGYGINASDDQVGSVTDLLFDADNWKLAWLSIDTGNWLPGQLVVVAAEWVKRVSWSERCIEVNMSKKQIEGSPPLSELSGLKKSFEDQLHNYYGYPIM